MQKKQFLNLKKICLFEITNINVFIFSFLFFKFFKLTNNRIMITNGFY